MAFSKLFTNQANLNNLLGLLAILVMFILAICVNVLPAFDEPFFLQNCHLLTQTGFSKDFLLQIKEQAPGPLYQITHWVFKPITQYDIVKMRFLNITLLLLCIYVLYKISIQFFDLKSNYFDLLLTFLIIPTTWVCSAIAITQIPALLFSLLGFWTLLLINQKKQTFSKGLLYAVLSGLFIGLATIGRAPYLLLILGPILGGFCNWKSPKLLLINIISIGFALAICLPVFEIWQGYVPPGQQETFMVKGNLNVLTLFTAFIYLTVFSLILSPQFTLPTKKEIVYFLSGFVILTSCNYIFSISHYQSTTLGKLLSFIPLRLNQSIAHPLYLCISVLILIKYLRYFLHNKISYSNILLMLIIFGIVFSSLKSSRFSDLYIFQALPFIILYLPKSPHQLLKSIVLMCLGGIYLTYRLGGFYH